MAKKNDMVNLKNIGLGILDSLSGIKEEKSKPIEEVVEVVKADEVPATINSPVNDNEKRVNNQKSTTVKKEKSKRVKEVKSKRSFMLSEITIQKLNLLKLCMNDKDLSSIVDEAVELYFNKNRKQVENLIEIYDQVK